VRTLQSPGVSDIVWPQVWRIENSRAGDPRPFHFSSYAPRWKPPVRDIGVLLALPFSEREFSSGRLSRLSDVRLPSRIGFSSLVRRELAGTPRGRAL
jgi:hypothetical protein